MKRLIYMNSLLLILAMLFLTACSSEQQTIEPESETPEWVKQFEYAQDNTPDIDLEKLIADENFVPVDAMRLPAPYEIRCSWGSGTVASVVWQGVNGQWYYTFPISESATHTIERSAIEATALCLGMEQ